MKMKGNGKGEMAVKIIPYNEKIKESGDSGLSI